MGEEKRRPASKQKRNQRLLVMLPGGELKVIEEWRFQKPIPSRGAAIRAMIRLGLESSIGKEAVANANPEEIEVPPTSSDVEILPGS